MAVTTQPRSNRKEAEHFVKELDPQVVLGAPFTNKSLCIFILDRIEEGFVSVVPVARLINLAGCTRLRRTAVYIVPYFACRLDRERCGG